MSIPTGARRELNAYESDDVSQSAVQVRVDDAVRRAPTDSRRTAATGKSKPKPVSEPADLYPIIFDQEWWLNAASEGAVEQVQVEWDHVVVGKIYFQSRRAQFFNKALAPPYTRILTPRINAPPGKFEAVSLNNIKIVDELAAKIKHFDIFKTVVRPDNRLLIPFQMNFFKLTGKFTFVSPVETTLDSFRLGMNQKLRNLVKTARESLTIETHHGMDSIRAILASRSEPDRNDYGALESIFSAVTARETGLVMAAVDDAGKCIAAALLVWDNERLYYIVSARRDGDIGNKASTLVFYESVALAKQKGLAFDADGYANVRSGRSLVKWGIPPSLNINISKGRLAYDTLLPAKEKFVGSPF